MNRPSDPPPNAFNSHEPPPPTTSELEIPNQEVGSPHEREHLPNAHPSATRQAFKKLYIILIVIGGIIGIFAAIGVVNLLDRWGLSDPPPPVEQRNY